MLCLSCVRLICATVVIGGLLSACWCCSVLHGSSLLGLPGLSCRTPPPRGRRTRCICICWTLLHRLRNSHFSYLLTALLPTPRSEERIVGTESVRTCEARRGQYTKKKN